MLCGCGAAGRTGSDARHHSLRVAEDRLCRRCVAAQSYEPFAGVSRRPAAVGEWRPDRVVGTSQTGATLRLGYGALPDFSTAYWTPPLRSAEAVDLERKAIAVSLDLPRSYR